MTFEDSPSDHETRSIRYHVGVHVDFNTHLVFTYFVGPSSVVWSELGPAPPFPPMRVLEVKWSQALSLMCEVALSCNLQLHILGHVPQCFSLNHLL